MIKTSCPKCQANFSGPDEIAGKKVRCPKCRALVIVEDHDDEDNFDFEPQRPDPEPWYYGYVEKYAKVLQILAYVVALCAAAPPTFMLFWALIGGVAVGKESAGLAIVSVIVSILLWLCVITVIVAGLLLWLVGVACILMAVDAARNVRKLKLMQN